MHRKRKRYLRIRLKIDLNLSLAKEYSYFLYSKNGLFRVRLVLNRVLVGLKLREHSILSAFFLESILLSQPMAGADSMNPME
jgi:hypothetical protein